MSRGKSIGAVDVGTWVKLLEQKTRDEEVFHIVESHQTNLLENKIPPDNPLGRALLGSGPGDEVSMDGPNGTVTFSVLEVGRQ